MTDARSATGSDATESWEDRYGGQEQMWSGQVNSVFAEMAAELPVGNALDLGCGEGADAVWLAEKGWQVTAVDVSATALARTRAAAVAAGVDEQVVTQCHDLASSFPEGSFALVTAQYLHSSGEFPRTAVLRQGARGVAVGGHLLIVDHGAAPPWMPDDHEHPDFPSVHETFDSLDLVPDRWRVKRMEATSRQSTGPSGEIGDLMDNVILVERRG